MPTDPNRQLVVTLTEEELTFVKDALWYAARAEQVVLSEDPLFRDSFLAELREIARRREEEGKPGFQDLFLALEGTPAESLPVEALRQLGLLADIPSTAEVPRRAEGLGQASAPASAHESSLGRLARGLRGLLFGR